MYRDNFCHGRRGGAVRNALFFCTITILPTDGFPAVVVNLRYNAAPNVRSM